MRVCGSEPSLRPFYERLRASLLFGSLARRQISFPAFPGSLLLLCHPAYDEQLSDKYLLLCVSVFGLLSHREAKAAGSQLASGDAFFLCLG